MAKHPIRRWLQFGIADMLILTLVVAVVVSLCRPIQAKASEGTPWLYGVWSDEKPYSEFWVVLFPDGLFALSAARRSETVTGKDWKLTRDGQPHGPLVLICGDKRFPMRKDGDGWAMELLDDDGKVQSRLKHLIVIEGPFREGTPHGVWKIIDRSGEHRKPSPSLTYQAGELIDAREEGGRRDLSGLNEMRRLQGLPPRAASDFPDEAPLSDSDR